jgi:hypothetical protein
MKMSKESYKLLRSIVAVHFAAILKRDYKTMMEKEIFFKKYLSDDDKQDYINELWDLVDEYRNAHRFDDLSDIDVAIMDLKTPDLPIQSIQTGTPDLPATPDRAGNITVASLPSELDTPEAKKIFDGLVKLNYCKSVGMVYQWTGTNALFGYMVLKTSDKLNIRSDNDRLPWKIYQIAFGMSDRQIKTAKNHISDLNNRKANEPTGYNEIIRLCK